MGFTGMGHRHSKQDNSREDRVVLLPEASSVVVSASSIQSFLSYVAQGEQDEADALLIHGLEKKQQFLRASAPFSDHAGRIFDCTAFEYACWALDISMCRMLQRHMDEDTKAFLLSRVTKNVKDGLTYEKDGELRRSARFSFKDLKLAYNRLVECQTARGVAVDGFEKILEAWRAVGFAQRSLPAHIAQEFCRLDRSFYPLPDFSDEILARSLMVPAVEGRDHYHWFAPNSKGLRLGFDYALTRGSYGTVQIGASWCDVGKRGSSILSLLPGRQDRDAITLLEALRLEGLTLEIQALSVSSARSLFDRMRHAAVTNDLEEMRRCKEDDPDLFDAHIASFGHIFFCCAATGGLGPVVLWLAENKRPEQVEVMSTSFDYLPFRLAARNGHLDFLVWLVACAPGQRDAMVTALHHDAFYSAAANGHFHILKTNEDVF